MYSKLIIYYWLSDRMPILFGILAGLLGTMMVTLWILYLSGKLNGWYHEERGREFAEKIKKPMYIISTIFIFFLVIAVMIPNPKTIIGYFALKQVDNYNIETIDSQLKTTSVISNVDDVLKIIDYGIQKAGELIKDNQ